MVDALPFILIEDHDWIVRRAARGPARFWADVEEEVRDPGAAGPEARVEELDLRDDGVSERRRLSRTPHATFPQRNTANIYISEPKSSRPSRPPRVTASMAPPIRTQVAARANPNTKNAAVVTRRNVAIAMSTIAGGFSPFFSARTPACTSRFTNIAKWPSRTASVRTSRRRRAPASAI